MQNRSKTINPPVSFYRIARGDKSGIVKCFAVNYHGDSRAIDPRNDLWNHSPDGFEFGYGGSGPAQLALAILADFTGDDAIAIQFHQGFKWDFIAALDRDVSNHEIDDTRIGGWLEQKRDAAASAKHLDHINRDLREKI